MKIIFDENVPWPLRLFLPDHEVTSVQREGHGGKGNGELLECLDGQFDVLVLCDKNLRYQQNLAGRVIAIVELPTNRWPLLKELEGEIRQAVDSSAPGAYSSVESSG
ncbi:MAG: hypothetical protein O3A87_04060 [Verrucomicrobia bacterium]|nr:hypothetical protein [Verrucomicrobiota bacterium]MDA1005639.1 hypothetical protein [Verrucomicrobiota bacterium]